MKATLSFTLPDEQEEYSDALNGSRALCVIREFDEWLRCELKYASPPPERESALTAVRDKLYELLEERNIRIWE